MPAPKTQTAKPPSAAEIREARHAVGHSQQSAANLVHVQLRTWQLWEAGTTNMPAGLWELYGIKTQRARAAAQATE